MATRRPLTQFVESYRFWDVVTLWARERLEHEDVVASALARGITCDGLTLRSVDERWIEGNDRAVEFKGENVMIDQRTAPYAALLLRITLGSLFISHLYWKFAIRGFDQWWTGLHDAGYATPIVIYVLCAEFAGALFLIPGILTRWVSLFALPVMLGASHFWLTRKGFFFTGAGAELPILWGLALIVQALLGDGAYAFSPSRRRGGRTGQNQLA